METAIGAERVIPYSVGICSASVCAAADASQDEIEEAVNESHPTGISSQWRISEDDFSGGEPNPSPCNTDESRKHWLLHC